MTSKPVIFLQLSREEEENISEVIEVPPEEDIDLESQVGRILFAQE